VSEKKLELNLQILYKHQEKNESLVFTFREKIKDLTLYHDRKKKNKKKIVIPQDNFNIGFYFNFTRFCRKQIMAGKAVK
jgi:hypothetical protein